MPWAENAYYPVGNWDHPTTINLPTSRCLYLNKAYFEFEITAENPYILGDNCLFCFRFQWYYLSANIEKGFWMETTDSWRMQMFRERFSSEGIKFSGNKVCCSRWKHWPSSSTNSPAALLARVYNEPVFFFLTFFLDKCDLSLSTDKLIFLARGWT